VHILITVCIKAECYSDYNALQEGLTGVLFYHLIMGPIGPKHVVNKSAFERKNGII
jgi:hypothetical protein